MIIARNFKVYENSIWEHSVGNQYCYCGWCSAGGSGYPIQCNCGGLIHADYVDCDEDNNNRLMFKCDKCGKIGYEIQ